MANGEFLNYPKARIALGAGDLVQVTKFNLKTTNGAKLKHTLRRRGAGKTMGVVESTLSFDLDVDEDGIERDYLDMILTGEDQTVSIKLPGGETRTFVGTATSETVDQPIDDACTVSIEMIGNVAKS
jgi:hypothetical protein